MSLFKLIKILEIHQGWDQVRTHVVYVNPESLGPIVTRKYEDP